MSIPNQNSFIKRLSSLQVRMTVSYVLVTLVIVLIFEILFSLAIYFLLTRSPLLAGIATYRAEQAAQTYAYQAALQSGGNSLNPRTTFQPGTLFSLTASLNGNDPANIPILPIGVPYQAVGSSDQPSDFFALLIAPDGTIVASSDPTRYPASATVQQLLPNQAAMIRNALSGKTASNLEGTSQNRIASVAQPVMENGNRPVGVIYIQSPAGLNDNALFSEIASGWVRSALGWLILMLPLGVLFGVVTSRGLVKRINRLVDATARYANGDYSQRVAISRPDEIGQLEMQFNQMAEQLVESFAHEKALTEQSARQEERARIEQELRTAQYIQKMLLPKRLPSLEGWTFQPYYQPAREVGGDLYDFLQLPDGQIGIVIGDVTGKGIAAALVMATTCTMLRSTARGEALPGEVLSRVNNLLIDHMPAGMFVTCFYAILDPESGRLRFANAGHDLPYRLDGGEVCELHAVGMPLGLMPEEQYENHEIALNPQESILFYTDGLVEAHNPEREMFGFPRLQAIMRDLDGGRDLIESLLLDLQKFTGKDWEQEDDVTLVTLQRQ